MVNSLINLFWTVQSHDCHSELTDVVGSLDPLFSVTLSEHRSFLFIKFDTWVLNESCTVDILSCPALIAALLPHIISLLLFSRELLPRPQCQFFLYATIAGLSNALCFISYF